MLLAAKNSSSLSYSTLTRMLGRPGAAQVASTGAPGRAGPCSKGGCYRSKLISEGCSGTQWDPAQGGGLQSLGLLLGPYSWGSSSLGLLCSCACSPACQLGLQKAYPGFQSHNSPGQGRADVYTRKCSHAQGRPDGYRSHYTLAQRKAGWHIASTLPANRG